MSGPAPKDPTKRRRTNAPARGEFKPPPGSGWQHGRRPKAPLGLMPESLLTWATWFDGWFAGYWTPADVPGLRLVIKLYDMVERGREDKLPELRLQMKAYGISPEGQMALRWVQPADLEPVPRGKAKGVKPERHAHLKAVE